MRAIDADALLQKAKVIKVKIGGDKVVDMIMVQDLMSAPTVEATPEATHWLFDKANKDKFICAECGNSISGDMIGGRYVAHNGFFPYPYCPMCGRKA